MLWWTFFRLIASAEFHSRTCHPGGSTLRMLTLVKLLRYYVTNPEDFGELKLSSNTTKKNYKKCAHYFEFWKVVKININNGDHFTTARAGFWQKWSLSTLVLTINIILVLNSMSRTLRCRNECHQSSIILKAKTCWFTEICLHSFPFFKSWVCSRLNLTLVSVSRRPMYREYGDRHIHQASRVHGELPHIRLLWRIQDRKVRAYNNSKITVYFNISSIKHCWYPNDPLVYAMISFKGTCCKSILYLEEILDWEFCSLS